MPPSRSSPRSSSSTSRSSSASRSLSAPLDPYGIYGTRTAGRLRASRRRRQTQGLVFLVIVAGVLASGFALAKLRKNSARAPDARLNLLSPVIASPVWARSGQDQDGKLQRDAGLLATTQGQLLRLDKKDFDKSSGEIRAPQVLLDTAFPLHAPLVIGDLAYVPCEDGALYAVRWTDGKTLWRANLGAPLTARPVFLVLPPAPNAPRTVLTERPASSDGSAPRATALPPVSPVPAKPRKIVIVGTDDGLLAALDANTGKSVWRVRAPAPVGEALTSLDGVTPRVLVPLLGGSAMRGGLWCLDARTGKTIWRFPTDARSPAMQLPAPVVEAASNRVFFNNDVGAIICVDATRGVYDMKKRLGWKAFARPSPGGEKEQTILLRAAPILVSSTEHPGASVRPARAVLITGATDGGVRAFDAGSGNLLWQFEAEAPIQSLQSLRYRNRECVLVIAHGRTLFVLDADRGAPLTRFASAADNFAGGGVMGEGAESGVLAVTGEGVVQWFALD